VCNRTHNRPRRKVYIDFFIFFYSTFRLDSRLILNCNWIVYAVLARLFKNRPGNTFDTVSTRRSLNIFFSKSVFNQDPVGFPKITRRQRATVCAYIICVYGFSARRSARSGRKSFTFFPVQEGEGHERGEEPRPRRRLRRRKHRCKNAEP